MRVVNFNICSSYLKNNIYTGSSKFYIHNKMKNKNYHTVGIIPKLNIKIVERGKIDTSNTSIHDRSLSLSYATRKCLSLTCDR